jgi:hypothetical protein
LSDFIRCFDPIFLVRIFSRGLQPARRDMSAPHDVVDQYELDLGFAAQ